MQRRCAAVALAVFTAFGAQSQTADPRSDAPEAPVTVAHPLKEASSYPEALALWRDADDLNAWLGHRFRYDMARAMQLSETQRSTGARLPIIEPARFFESPEGVCVDLSRFAVETLRAIAPGTQPKYLMIEFDPVTLQGNTLRRHWVVSFERDGQRYFFADSKRPGHIAGPYAQTQQFIDDYAAYRGRRIVAFREVDTYARGRRTPAARQTRS